MVRKVTKKVPVVEVVEVAPVEETKAKGRKKSGVTAPRRTRKAPAAAETPPVGSGAKTAGKIRLYQIYYQPQQKPLLDPEFEPFDNAGDKNPLLEFNVFQKLAAKPETQTAALWGALSWKFMQKTGLSGWELRDYLAANPGFDVYYCNPHPEVEALYHNLWVQGETAHPDFLMLSRAFFQAAELPLDALEELQSPSLYSTANYLIGTPEFWSRYLVFVQGALLRAEKNLSLDIKRRLFSTRADHKGVHAGATYLPFIVERLFGVFLQHASSGLRAHKIKLPIIEKEMNIHLQMLRQMKDAAVQQRSAWLLACWANYRALYFTTFHGKEWIKKYLRIITPVTLKYGNLPSSAAPESMPG